MNTRLNRLLVPLLFSVAILSPPSSVSAQVLEDDCAAKATITPPSPGGNLVVGTASYTCTGQQPLINVSGCLLEDGVPVFCTGKTKFDSSSVTVDLRFPCLPGVWSAVAVGAGANRVLPAADVAPPEIIMECDPLSP